MGRYAPWLQLDVEHAYFDDARRCPLRWAPRADTAAWLRRAGCPWRSEAAGWILLHDGGALPPLGDDGPAVLHFEAQATDALLAGVTSGRPRDPARVPRVDATRAKVEGPLRVLVPPADPDRDPASVWRPAAPSAARPFLTLAMALPTAADPPPHHYLLRLASRATIWKYLLIGDWGPDPLEVVDAANAVRFGAAEPQALADGSSAWAIRSSRPIALRERGDERFMLRTRAPKRAAAKAGTGSSSPPPTGRVLVKRLPVANGRQFGLEAGAKAPTLVSEIYVHR